ncbi:MAG: cobyric acid synthase [Syntrophomonadaceae bacterium]|nr:cobyric acid synthase [Syntrophomonadaceae bacterium]
MAKAIMIQGTMSNAGKSIIAAGLCRIFRQDGYRVAPFKSQNMALNSFITREGLEMGRAQVVQAEAAGIEPSVLMNPVLLKPTSETGSQVILNGEIYGNMSAGEYYRKKREIIPQIKKAFDELAAKFDLIVIEGAGSPAEINLKENDIVNMYIAKMAAAPVLLAGDIDRGGVFASLLGTMMILDDSERALVKATLINKFRGDRAILQPGLDMLEAMIRVPTLGVIPYLDIDIDDEDSLSHRFDQKAKTGLIDIAVIRLPRISNFTDFNVFECMPGVTLRYVTAAAQLGKPDMIILPGTKNTMEDLRWMRQNGLETAILKHAAEGRPIFGVCGGYQMLGEKLSDPYGAEHGGTMEGMKLLPAETVFAREKTRAGVKGRFTSDLTGCFKDLAAAELNGYEIHMGQTRMLHDYARDLTVIEEISGQSARKLAGMCCGNIYGTYIHGIFDHEDVAPTMVTALAREKGMNYEAISGFDMQAYKERQYDLLAQGIRENINMKMLYEIIDKGV